MAEIPDIRTDIKRMLDMIRAYQYNLNLNVFTMDELKTLSQYQLSLLCDEIFYKGSLSKETIND